VTSTVTLSARAPRFLEQRAAAIDVSGIEHPCGSSDSWIARRTSSSPRAPVAEVQMQNSGLAGHQACDMRFAREAQQFIVGGLAER